MMMVLRRAFGINGSGIALNVESQKHMVPWLDRFKYFNNIRAILHLIIQFCIDFLFEKFT